MTSQDSRFLHLLHVRQFICGPRAVQAGNMSGSARFSRHVLGLHQDLVATSSRLEDREALCLGQLLDPAAPQRGNAEILDGMLRHATSFEALEQATARLGGRWLLFARIGDEHRLYPDAAGTRSAFHALSSDGVWIASQPGLLAAALGIGDSDRLRAEFAARPHNATSWPCSVTPFEGVRQLLPNHYLDLRTGVAHRFWPKEPIPRLDLDTAAATISNLLRGSIAAALARGTAAMPLTGGYDSRTLFACAGDLRRRVRCFAVAGHHSAHHDRSIPRRLGRRFGVEVAIVRPEPQPPAFSELIRRNTARMWWDPADYMVYAFRAADARIILFGLLAEIARCFYYPDGRHPAVVTPRLLADVTHFGEHAIAEAAFADWLATVPADSGIATLDLLYWEHRAGNWVAMTCTTFDAIADIIAPYNCRALLEAALGVEAIHRAPPHALHRRICELAEPGTLAVPFNFSRVDQLQAAIARVVPWRIRNAMQRLRKRLAGFQP